MIIDFKEIGVSVIPNFKGGEKETARTSYRRYTKSCQKN